MLKAILKVLIFRLHHNFQEGRQASLAADFSITQFKYLGRLLVWHGRNRFVYLHFNFNIS